MKVTYYNAMDKTNTMKLIVSAPIGANTAKDKMDALSFKLNK